MPNSALVINRFAVIGDVHGEDVTLAAILDFLKEVGPLDAILCTGDLPGRTGNTERCVTLLKSVQAILVQGNHDAGAMREKPRSRMAPILSGLPRTRSLVTSAGSLLLCHGVGSDFMAGIYPGGTDEPICDVLRKAGIYDRYRLMIAGHTHQRLVRSLGSLTLINPGALTEGGLPGFAMVNINNNRVQFYDLTPQTHEIHLGESAPLFSVIGSTLEGAVPPQPIEVRNE